MEDEPAEHSLSPEKTEKKCSSYRKIFFKSGFMELEIKDGETE